MQRNRYRRSAVRWYLSAGIYRNQRHIQQQGSRHQKCQHYGDHRHLRYRTTYNTTGTNIGRVYNNFVYNITSGFTGAASATRQIEGIFANDTGGSTTQENNIDFNSVRIDGSGSPTISNSCFEISTAGGALNRVRNNIFANFTGAQTGVAKHYTFASTSNTALGGTETVSNFNDLYVANTTNGFVGVGSSLDYATLANFRTAYGQDAGSISADPLFVSTTDLHVAANSPVVDAGVAISGISQDIDGQNRVGTPDIGADEPGGVTPPVNDIAATAITNPATGSTVTVGATVTPTATFTNVGSATQTNVTVQFTITGPGSYSYTNTQTIASIAANQTVTVTFAATPVFTAGGTYTTTASVITADANTGNDSAAGTFTVFAPITGGTVSVGTGQAYTSLTNSDGVFNAINSGTVTSNIIINITSDLTGATGAVALNQFAAGFTVTIEPSGTARIVSGSATTALIKLNGADNVTIDGSTSGGTNRSLTINNTNATGTAVIWLSSLGAGLGATNDTVKNTNIIGGSDTGTSTTDTFGIIASGTTVSASGDGADNDTNTFDNNTVTKVRYGIYLRGVSTNTNDNNTISGNLIGSSAFDTSRISKGGIVIQHQNAVNITRNEIRFVGILAADAGAGTDRVGIGVGDFSWTPTTTAITNATVTRNLIHDIVEEKTFSSVGIVLGPSGTTATNNLVANNMIYNVRANGTSGDQGLGIGIAGGDADKVVFNSISLTGDIDPAASSATQSEAGVRVSSAAAVTNLMFMNNAISVDVTSNTATLKHYTFVKPSATYSFGTGGSNYNDYFVNAANAQMVLFGNGTAVPYTDVATLALFQAETPTHDANSKNIDPVFASATDLHLQAVSGLINVGIAVSDVTVDFDGRTRDATPDIGADEIVAANTAPTIADIVDQAATVGVTKVVNFTVSDAETLAGATVTATSSNTAVAANPTVTYTSGGTSGSLSTSPLTAGTTTITVTVTDGGGLSASDTFVLTVTAANSPPTISAVNVSRVKGSTAVNSQIASVGDVDQAANTLSVTAAAATGSGVTVTVTAVSAAGVVTANVAATCAATNSTFTLTVTDGSSATATATATVTVTDSTVPTQLVFGQQPTGTTAGATITPAVTVLVQNQCGVTVNSSVQVTVAIASGGGTLVGTATVTASGGTATFGNLAVNGSAGARTLSASFSGLTGATSNSFDTTAPTITVAPATLPNGVVGTACNQTISATGGTANYTFAFTAGSLPTGLTLSSGGVLSGTPSAAGTFNFTITATDANGFTGSQAYAVTINSAPAFTSANSTAFTVGTAGSFSVTTSGAPTPTTITSSGTLPSGVTFVNNGNGTATLAGTPAAGTAGSYPLTFTASNGISPDATQSFTLTVTAQPALSVSDVTLNEGNSGTTTFTFTVSLNTPAADGRRNF